MCRARADVRAWPGTGRRLPRWGIAIGGECVEVDQAADQIRQLIRDASDADHLNAVIVSVQVDDVPVLTEVWGESMTGVPATPDMHFRNGAVAIAISQRSSSSFRIEG